MVNTIFSHSVPNMFVTKGMIIYLVKAYDKNAISDKYDSLCEDFPTLSSTAIMIYREGEQHHAVIILSTQAFVSNPRLFNEAKNAALTGQYGEVIDLCHENEQRLST